MQILGRGAIHVLNFVTLSQQIMPTYTCGERLQRGGLAAFFVSLYVHIIHCNRIRRHACYVNFAYDCVETYTYIYMILYVHVHNIITIYSFCMHTCVCFTGSSYL